MAYRTHLDHLYKEHFDDFCGVDTVCVYCGEPATCIDHVVPLNYVRMLLDTSLRPKRLYTVSSCRECNSLAGDKVFESFKKKKAFIQQTLLEKYRHLLKSPVWSDKELDQLGYALCLYIKAQQAMRESIIVRTKWKGTCRINISLKLVDPTGTLSAPPINNMTAVQAKKRLPKSACLQSKRSRTPRQNIVKDPRRLEWRYDIIFSTASCIQCQVCKEFFTTVRHYQIYCSSACCKQAAIINTAQITAEKAKKVEA